MHVLVTGANGHLGHHLVTVLLARGHRVRAGVRDARAPAKTAALRAPGVEVVDCDVMRPEQLRTAMAGIEVVFHAATVYSYLEPQRAQEIVDVSVQGAQSALRAAAEAKVRKVVPTSSVVTLPLTAHGAPPATEAAWSNDLRMPYMRAKTHAEQAAWALAGKLGLNLVTVLPGSIGGPGWDQPTPTIVTLEAMMLNASRMGCPDGNLPYVDVRDAARAHLLAAERNAQGRFIACNDELPTFEKLVATMHTIDPRVRLPLMRLPDAMMPLLPLFDWINAKTLDTPRIAAPDLLATLRGKRFNVSNRRAKDLLGWQPRFDLRRSLRDTMAEMRARRAGRAPARSVAAAGVEPPG